MAVTASQLLAESAEPFDRACTMVKSLELQLRSVKIMLHKMAYEYEEKDLKDTAKKLLDALNANEEGDM